MIIPQFTLLNHLRRIPSNHHPRLNILCNYRARSNYSALTNGHTWKNCCPRSNPNTITNRDGSCDKRTIRFSYIMTRRTNKSFTTNSNLSTNRNLRG